jgi:hypothetical protein
MRPQRVQLSRTKGWRMPENTVKVDRTTKWGNPFVIGEDGTQEECIRQFELLVSGRALPKAALTGSRKVYRAMVHEHIKELRARNLACWCEPGTPCHADVLLKLANG